VHDQRGTRDDDCDKRSRSEDLVRDPRVREIPDAAAGGRGSSLLLWTSGQRLFRLPAGHRGWLFNCAYPLKSAHRIKGLVGTAEGPRAHKETLLSPRRPRSPVPKPRTHTHTHNCTYTRARVSKHYTSYDREDGDLNVRDRVNGGAQKN
jgi:hypothetical protein